MQTEGDEYCARKPSKTAFRATEDDVKNRIKTNVNDSITDVNHSVETINSELFKYDSRMQLATITLDPKEVVLVIIATPTSEMASIW